MIRNVLIMEVLSLLLTYDVYVQCQQNDKKKLGHK